MGQIWCSLERILGTVWAQVVNQWNIIMFVHTGFFNSGFYTSPDEIAPQSFRAGEGTCFMEIYFLLRGGQRRVGELFVPLLLLKWFQFKIISMT